MPSRDQFIAEDTAWTFQVPTNAFADVDSSTLTYTATLSDGVALPAWLTFDAATRTFSGTPPQDFNGALELKVTASDGSLSVSDTFTLTIDPVNDAPTWHADHRRDDPGRGRLDLPGSGRHLR